VIGARGAEVPPVAADDRERGGVEVPRAGAVVFQSFQRTRRPDGAVVTWFGARKETGRGEGSSGLRFDALVATAPAATS